MLALLKQFGRDESGATAIEYALIAGSIGIVIITVIGEIGQSIVVGGVAVEIPVDFLQGLRHRQQSLLIRFEMGAVAAQQVSAHGILGIDQLDQEAVEVQRYIKEHGMAEAISHFTEIPANSWRVMTANVPGPKAWS